MKKSLYIFVALVTLAIGGYGVKAEELKCDYYYYYNGNNLNQGSATSEHYANCTYEFKNDGSLKAPSCLINYYIDGKEKTKKVTIHNWQDEVSGHLTLKIYMENNKKCPDYMVAHYNIEKGIFGVDLSKFQVDAAIDEAKAKEIELKWANVNDLPNTRMLRNVNLEYSEDEKNEAYEKIEEWTKLLEQANSSGEIDLSACADESVLITRYTECEKLYKNMSVALNTTRAELLKYTKNGYVDENDEKVKKLFQLIDEYQKKVDNFQMKLEEADCEIKLQLGLVDSCAVADEEELEGIAACAAIGNNSKTGKQIKKIITIMKIAIPLLIIVFSIIDLIKVLVSEDDKVFKGTWSNFIKRCIVGVVFFLVPALLRLLFTITEILDIYSIDANSIFCYLI